MQSPDFFSQQKIYKLLNIRTIDIAYLKFKILISCSMFISRIHAEELVTPFAQILSTLKNARANFFMLTNIRDKQFRRGSEGFHLNSRLCQLYEISDGSMIRGEVEFFGEVYSQPDKTSKAMLFAKILNGNQ